MKVVVEGLCYAADQVPIITDIDLHIGKGEFVGIIGPNGSGKSTLLKNIYQALRPNKGKIILNGADLFKLPHKEVAREMAVLCQENAIPFDFRVYEIVGMGRHPHKRLFSPDTAEDLQIIKEALLAVGMLDMAERSFTSLSGGEKQRVLIARALAQRADLLILDEPTNHLDISYQMQFFESICSINITILAAIHDLNIAAMFCDRICVIKDTRLMTSGTPGEVLTEENIRAIFNVQADVSIHPLTGRPAVTYLPQSARRLTTGIRASMQ